MNKRLYKLMDWAFIEEVIYSECDHPQDLMGPHVRGNSTLVQAFFPGAGQVAVEWYDSNDPEKKKNYAQMELADEEGFFAVLLPTKTLGSYSYTVTTQIPIDEEGKTFRKETFTTADPYAFDQILSKKDLQAFMAGSAYKAQELLGAHPTKIGNVAGVHFAVWAPGAMRVSVIGEFNGWDGRCHQMRRLGDSGIFEIFIPGAKEGQAYLYEVKLHRGQLLMRLDPFARRVSFGDRKASVISGKLSYTRKHADLAGNLKKIHAPAAGISICRLSGQSLLRVLGADSAQERSDLVGRLKNARFTHVLLPSVLCGDGAVLGFFALHPGVEEKALCELIDLLHGEGIGVVLSANLSGFSRENMGLAGFDGSCLYEHLDPRQGLSADGRMCLFHYGSPQVRSMLISAVLDLVQRFGADGLLLEQVAQMLYLDYGKSEGQWVANLYGGNENLEAIDFIRELMNALSKAVPGILKIAEDSSAHPQITDAAADGGLGFDLKLNLPFSENLLQFLSLDPFYRGQHLSELTNDIVYSFVDTYLLGTGDGGNDLVARFPGDEQEKLANLKLAIAYEFVHPGKKLLSLSGREKVDTMISALNALYEKLPALHRNDQDHNAFEWLSNMNTEQCFLSFLRKTDDPEEMLMVVANFSGIGQNITTGVPYEGKYKEIFNTDDLVYGGTGVNNKQIRRAGDTQSDGRAQSVNLKMGPLSLAIFQFIPYTEEELAKVITERIRRNTPLKRKKETKKSR